MAILPDDIKDLQGADKNTGIIFRYIRYMREQLEFWASRISRSISTIQEALDAFITFSAVTNTVITAADCVNIASPATLQASVLQSGNTCELRLISNVTPAESGSGWQTIFNIPVTPSRVHHFVILNSSDYALARVTASGHFDIYDPVANKEYFGGCTFIL